MDDMTSLLKFNKYFIFRETYLVWTTTVVPQEAIHGQIRSADTFVHNLKPIFQSRHTRVSKRWINTSDPPANIETRKRDT